MQPAIVTPRESPVPVHLYVPGCDVALTAWRVESVGMLVELVSSDNYPYLGDILWAELDHSYESKLFRRLREKHEVEYYMTCEKTGLLWEGMYHVFGATPVNSPNFNTSVSLGLFTTTDTVPGLDNGTSRSALYEIRDWLRYHIDNNFRCYDVPKNWINIRNGTHAAQKLGDIVCARDTAAYIALYHGEIVPFWGDMYSDIIAKYVDLNEISQELADLLNYTITHKNH